MMDLLIHNAKIADVFRLRIFQGWVGIRDGRFIYAEEGDPPEELASKDQLDANGLILVPGLIDSHMHIESSLITPRRFAEAVLPFGTTTILADPHEVGNVAGEAGVEWMIRASENLPLRILHSIPSCVPATSPEIEWTAQVFDAEVIKRLAGLPGVIALGEVMDYRGMLGANPRLQEIVRAAKEANLLVEGHIPTLSGIDLSEYLAHGISSDHTLTFEAKIQEQLSKGLAVMLQKKSITPENVAVVADLFDRSRILLITDDIEPGLLGSGHLSSMIQRAIDAGMPELEAVASATIRPARYLGLRDLGGVAPGFRADFMLMDDFRSFPPVGVYAGGNKIAADGAMLVSDFPELPPLPPYSGIPGPLTPDDFKLATEDGQIMANVVVLQNKKTTLTELEALFVHLEAGHVVFSEGDDLALVGIFARNGRDRAVGIIKNTGFTDGAMASSVAHDSHNLIVIGRDPGAMSAAANAVHEMDGGVAVADQGGVLATLELPYFGLLSDNPVDEVAADFSEIEQALRSLGVDHERPFLTFSIMGLSVSPYVKFTDKGIVDTETRTLMPTWVSG